MTASRERSGIFAFVALSLGLMLLVFGDALWARSILAPVDIAPAFWSRFRFVDPQSNGLPQNHHVVDQLSYDLPLQWTIYHAWRRGEVPWWDPFTYCGRPLLADAHCNAADPIRILTYLSIPDFVLAYNWTLILHRIIGGAGALLLLRSFGSPKWAAMLLAAAWEFAGFNAVFWGHPWVAAAFAWYPWLWFAWNRCVRSRTRWTDLHATLLCTAILLAGNLQSHPYLPLFALAWVAGAGEARRWRERLKVAVTSGLLGAMIATPILVPEVELFFQNDRPLVTSPPWPIQDALLWLSTVYPWSLGTFRTIGYNNNFGFVAWIGSIATALALIGFFSPVQDERLRAVRRVGFALLVLYLTILVTPLNQYLYTRSAGLGALGLLALATIGMQQFNDESRFAHRWGVAMAAMCVVIALGVHAGALLLYPRMLPRIKATVAERAARDEAEARPSSLREKQLESFVGEVTFANPEAAIAWLGMLGLAVGLMVPALRSHPATGRVLLAANLVPVLWFTHRFVPRVSTVHWDRLRAGSEEQQRVSAELRGRHLRLRDVTPGEFAKLFPMNMAHLQGIHVVHGYAALQPKSMKWRQDADESYVSDRLFDGDTGAVRRTNSRDHCRLSFEGSPDRPVQFVEESMCRLDIATPDRKGGRLIRTDTYYPGWIAMASDGSKLRSEKMNGIWTAIEVPKGVERVVLIYRPTARAASTTAAAVGILGIVICSIWSLRFSPGQVRADSFGPVEKANLSTDEKLFKYRNNQD